jgi:hypothetical protein
MEIERTLNYYASSGALKETPAWWRWFYQVGSSLGGMSCGDSRAVICAALPARGFSSLFVALGAVTACGQLQDTTNEEHFKDLMALRTETPVVFVTEKNGVLRKHVGKITEPIRDRGRTLLGVIWQDNEARMIRKTRYFSVENCRELSVLETETDDVNIESDRGTKVSRNAGFISEWIPTEQLDDFLGSDQTTCLLVGTKQQLLSEMQEPFVLGDAEGSLMDLIRPVGLPQFVGSSKTRIQSASSSEVSEDDNPSCVVYDGANGFLKWQHFFPHANHIVLLDRTERRFWDATNELNLRFLQRTGESSPEEYGTVPDMLDVMAFREHIA